MLYTLPEDSRKYLRSLPLLGLLTETPIMAPLAAGAALLITREFHNSQIWPEVLVIREASRNDASGDSNIAPGNRNAWLFAPILIFVLIVVSLFWLACFTSRMAKKDAKKRADSAKEAVKSVVQDLPDPRPWGGASKCDKSAMERATGARSDGSDEEVCSICLETFVSVDMVRQMRACSHVFHQQCLEDWIVQHRSNVETCTRKLRCPMCRRGITANLKSVDLKKPAEVYFGF